MTLKGKVVLITGASEGIGAACARELQKRGARLSLTARSQSKLEEVGGAAALITAGDITEDEVRSRVVSRTLERFGEIDILINNAGRGIYWPAWEAPMAEARALFELNFFAALAMAQAVTPPMRARGTGTIVNISSIAGQITLPWLTLYSASKFAVCSLTEGLRMELKRDGIHAMAVCPGYVKTSFQDHALGSAPPASIVKGKRFAITAEHCARDIANGVERGARTVVTPKIGRAILVLAHLFPSLVERQLNSANRARE